MVIALLVYILGGVLTVMLDAVHDPDTQDQVAFFFFWPFIWPFVLFMFLLFCVATFARKIKRT